jgi:hypothetical protein
MPLPRRLRLSPDHVANPRRLALNIVLGAALVDGVFLVATALLAIVSPGGTAFKVAAVLYVFGWVYLLYLVATGAMRGRWGWWYLGLVLVTLGPLGAVLGARRLLAAEERPPPPSPKPPAAGRPTRKEQRKAATEQRRAGGRR